MNVDLLGFRHECRLDGEESIPMSSGRNGLDTIVLFGHSCGEIIRYQQSGRGQHTGQLCLQLLKRIPNPPISTLYNSARLESCRAPRHDFNLNELRKAP